MRQSKRAEELLEKRSAQCSSPDGESVIPILRSYICLTQGRYEEALDLASNGLYGENPIVPVSIVPIGHLVMATASMRRSDVRSASRYARKLAEDSLFGRLRWVSAEAAWVVAQVTEMEQGSKAAALPMGEVTRNALVSPELFLSQPAAAPSLVRLALAGNDGETAERIACAARRVAARYQTFQTFAASAIHASGLSVGHVDSVLKASAQHTDPWTRALATEDAGVLLVKHRTDLDRSIPLLESALRSYGALGSTRDAARVKSTLRQIRDGSSHPPLPKSPIAAQYGLTATEASVADLVSQGLTNAEAAKILYLSRHTVAYHLKSIFKKLAVSSRGELTNLWVQIRLAPSRQAELA
jgi:DNA-binding CsgD family transcriptional regulator